MANQGDNAPDLASVLAALAKFAPAPSGTGVVHEQTQEPQTHYGSAPEASGSVVYDRFDPRRPAPQRRDVTVQKTSRPESPFIAADTITEWPMGLRCVMQMEKDNLAFKANVRKVCGRMD